jgi:hypothetical protein
LSSQFSFGSSFLSFLWVDVILMRIPVWVSGNVGWTRRGVILTKGQ